MLHPRFTSPFTRDVYDAIVREIKRISPAMTDKDKHRLEVLQRWQSHLEADTAIDMEITRFPPWPIRLS